MKRVLFTFLITLLFHEASYGQLLINEICPANISVVQNNNGDYNDYIEIINSGQNPINLENYGIADEIDSTRRYIFPSHIIHAGSKMLIFAVGNKEVENVDHYEMPVDGHAVWKYSYDSSVTDNSWRELSYNDNQWSTGEGGIGYGDNDDGTIIPVCQSVKMRYSFDVQDSLDILEAVFMMDFDDGFTAYLNGVEIATKNMWPGKVPWNVFATDAHEAAFYQGLPLDSFYIDPIILKSIIRNGENVLAVQTHNVEPNSSDLSSMAFLFFGMKDEQHIYANPPAWFIESEKNSLSADFKLKRTGETVYLFNPAGGIIGQVQYPAIGSDHCYARSTDGAIDWCINTIPTPLAANDPFSCYSGYTDSPVFSLQSGFYSSAQTINLYTSQSGATIRYSTNGDEPDSNSTLYSAAIILDSTRAVRARVFANGFLPGRTISNSYFINEQSHLPVFSISTDSLNLWDDNTGIYVLGPNADSLFPYLGANYWEDWRKPAAVEYYDRNKQKILSFNAEIEIYGNYSRSEPQKSFEIHLKDKYETGSINYPLINDKSFITKYENIILRNSGTDWNVVHFRDALMEKIMENTFSGYLAAEPIRLFLNGSDWGVYNIHEKNNHKWVETNFGLKKGEFDFLVEQGSKIMVEEGSDKDFRELYDYATGNDPGTNEYYDQLNSKLDLKNYADYFIAETFYNNGDWIGEWTNNIKIWKPKSENGRWKYLLLDLDFGFGLYGNVNDNRLEMARNPSANSQSSNIFDAILENPKFKNYFINRYADLLNTIYLPPNVESAMRSFKDSMAFDMIYHFNKWGSDTVQWNFEINRMMSFASQRPDITRDMIKNQFNLNGKVSLTLQTNPPQAGRIEINTITPLSYPWTGIYFNGNPVTITAIPNPGYTFDHWVTSPLTGQGTDQQISLNYTSDDLITAYFTGTAGDAQLTVSEFNYNSNPSLDAEDWIELYNYGSTDLDISGWMIKDEEDHHSYKFPTGTKIITGGYLVVTRDTCAFNEIYPDVLNSVGTLGFSLNNSGDEIRLYDYLGQPYLSFIYQTELPWPLEADGGGYTCELQNNSTDLSNGNNWAIGCFGGSPGKASSNDLNFNLPLTGKGYFCYNDVDTLNTKEFPDATYQWSFEGNPISDAISPNYPVDKVGPYYIDLTIHNCTGRSKIISVVETPLAIAPKVINGSRCGEGSVLLMANAPDSIYWYNSMSDEAISNGNTLLTPELTANRTYYVRSGNICPSEFVKVEAKIRTECESAIAIYPNPSSGEASLILHYENLEAGNGLVQITDCCGKVLNSFAMEFSEYRSTYDIPVGGVPPGVYLVSLYQNDFIHVTKMVRQ